MRTPRQIVAIHRWLGVLLCLFMAAWFASGAVLMYVPFPELSATERFVRASEVDVSRVTVTPAEAARAIGSSQPIDRIRLVARLGRPLYVLQSRGSAVSAIWADNGKPALLQSVEEITRVAEQFTAARVRQIDGPLDYDQWIVHQGFDSGRPYFRVEIDDDAGTELYLSMRSGEVLQRTRRVERTWNYVGAVVHWIYPTVLRRNWAAWDQVVWWLSLAGISVVIIGVWLGIDRMIIALRSRKKQISLFRGWMKWHHVLGLCAFVFVLSWIFSGWLSMDHGRIFSMPDPTSEQVDRYRGIALVDAADRLGLEFIRNGATFRELDIKAVAAIPLVIVRSHDSRRVYTLDPAPSYVGHSVPLPLIKAAVENAWTRSTVRHFGEVADDDMYRQVRQSKMPESTVRVKLDDPRGTWVHVDATSGEINSVMDRGRRVYRWLYHGLHSLDFPALVNRRPLWDAIMLSLLTLGFSFSVTGVFLGIRRLKRSVPPSRAVS